MRFRDVTDFFKLRRIAENPWEIVRFRKSQRPGQTLEVRMRDGCPLYLRGGCADFHMFHRIWLCDEYRVGGQPAGSWKCVIDLGANVGVFSVRAAHLAQRVVAFEPFAACFAQLQRNVAARQAVVPVCEAVAAEVGTRRMYRPAAEGQTGAYSVFPAANQGRLSDEFVEVQTTTLEELFRRFEIDRCDLLKIDVEGAEYEIIYGASESTLARIDRIHGEYHDVRPEDPRTRIDAFGSFLRDQGYEVVVHPHRRKPNHGMFFCTRPGLSATAE